METVVRYRFRCERAWRKLVIPGSVVRLVSVKEFVTLLVASWGSGSSGAPTRLIARPFIRVHRLSKTAEHLHDDDVIRSGERVVCIRRAATTDFPPMAPQDQKERKEKQRQQQQQQNEQEQQQDRPGVAEAALYDFGPDVFESEPVRKARLDHERMQDEMMAQVDLQIHMRRHMLHQMQMIETMMQQQQYRCQMNV
jgi:hypothetical protein